jgi:hypothetical protein
MVIATSLKAKTFFMKLNGNALAIPIVDKLLQINQVTSKAVNAMHMNSVTAPDVVFKLR